MHLIGSISGGRIHHTFRRPDSFPNSVAGTWTRFVDIEREAQGGVDRGIFNQGDVACASNDLFNVGEPHICVVNNIGQVWHAIRKWNWGTPDTSANWTALGDVIQQCGNVGVHARIACSIDSNGGLHVVTCTKDGKVWHTLRDVSGTWTPFGDVKGQCGNPGKVIDVTCAADGLDLHHLIVTDVGSIYHTIRTANGQWPDKYDWVQGKAGRSIHSSYVRGRTISCWANDGHLAVWVVSQDDEIIYTGRNAADRKWSYWSPEARWFTGVPKDISCSGSSSVPLTHLAVVTDKGGLFHKLLGVGSGDVQGQAGYQGEFISVAIAAC